MVEHRRGQVSSSNICPKLPQASGQRFFTIRKKTTCKLSQMRLYIISNEAYVPNVTEACQPGARTDNIQAVQVRLRKTEHLYLLLFRAPWRARNRQDFFPPTSDRDRQPRVTHRGTR